MKDVVITSRNSKILVSTVFTQDEGWETMAFKYNGNGKVNPSSVLTRHYINEREAEKGHKYAQKIIKKYY